MVEHDNSQDGELNSMDSDTQALPTSLQSLAESIAILAFDLRWTWSHEGDAVWARLIRSYGKKLKTLCSCNRT